MNLKNNDYITFIGQFFGFGTAFIFFTTILFLVFSFINNYPKNLNYFHIINITILITFTGIINKKILK